MVDIFSLCSKKIGFQLQLKGLDANFPEDLTIIVPLPKSSNENRIVENTEIFDFELNKSDMDIIDNMPPCGGFCVDADNAPEDT